MLKCILNLRVAGRPPSIFEQVLTSIKAKKASIKSPMLERGISHEQHRALGLRECLHRYDGNHTTPTKSDTATVEERHVKPIRSSANLLEDGGVMGREAGWNGSLPLLDLPRRLSVSAIDGDLFFIWVLMGRLGCNESMHGG